MSTSSTSVVSGVSGLAAELFKQVDADRDGRLALSEFQTFLQNLIRQVGSRSQTPGLGSEAAAVSPLAKLAAGTSRVYQPMLGFDYTKLNTPSHNTPKYVFARATQDVELGWDRASRSAGLESIAENVRQNGYPNARVTGDDTIDFGDGYGNIDVLTSDGQWWWGPER
jgi:hypothetical protein